MKRIHLQCQCNALVTAIMRPDFTKELFKNFENPETRRAFTIFKAMAWVNSYEIIYVLILGN